MSLLIVLFVIGRSYCSDFHLIKNISVSNMRKIVAIQSIDENTIAIQDGPIANCTIKVLSGENYNNPIKSISKSGLVSWPAYTRKGVLLNFGTQVEQSYYQQDVTTFDGLPLAGNLLQNGKYSIFSLARKCPTLALLNTADLTISYKQYESGEDCKYESTGTLSDIGDGTIAYAYKYTIYIIDYNTLQLISKYSETQQVQSNSYRYVGSYYDSSVNTSVLLVQYSANNSKKYKLLTLANTQQQQYKQDREYKASVMNYNPFPSPNIKFTSLHSGISFHNNTMYRWQNLHSIIVRDNSSNQSLTNSFPTVIFNNQSMFIVDSSNTLSMYQLSEDYNIKRKYVAVVKGIYYVLNSRLTHDDTTLVFTAFSEHQMGIICKMDLNTKDLTCLNQSRLQPMQMDVSVLYSKSQHKNNNIQFEYNQKINVYQNMYKHKNQNIMANRLNNTANSNKEDNNNIGRTYNQQLSIAGSYDCGPLQLYSNIDRMISFCINATFAVKYYEIHLYRISDLKLLTSIRVSTSQFWWTNVKLVKNQATFNYSETYFPSFILIFKLNDNYANTDDTISIRYNIQNDTIIRTKLQSNSLSYFKVHAYGQYIVSMKLKNKTHSIDALQFYDYQTLTFITKVPYPQAATYNRYDIKPASNLIILDQKFLLNASYVYDLNKKHTQTGWFRGSFYRDQFRGNLREINQNGLYFIFPQRGLFYCYRTLESRVDQPYKLIYNIANPAIKQAVVIGGLGPKDKAQGHIYLPALQNIKGREQPVAFYIYNSFTLIKYRDDGSKQTSSYNIQNGEQLTAYVSITYQSQTKQHIIVSSLEYDRSFNPYQHITIRRIDDPSVVVYQENKAIRELIVVQFADYMESGKRRQVIVGGRETDKVNVIDISQHVTDASEYGLQRIDLVDAGELCTAAAGPTLQNISNIIINNNNTNDLIRIVQNYKILHMVINNKCNGVASVTQQGYIKVWDISKQPIVILKQQIDVQQLQNIKYVGQYQIILQYTNNTINIYNISNTINIYNISNTVDLNSINSIYNINSINSIQQNNNNNKIAVSKDGKYIASTINSTYVKILQNNLQIIRNFKLPINSTSTAIISSLAFTQSSNQLIVSTQTGSMYILSPTPCPSTYTNIDSLCMCKANQTQVDSTVCKCKTNFVFANATGTCECPEEQFIYNTFNGKCECGYNSSQVDSKCVCKNNFVKSSNMCYCDTLTFIYIKGLCYCHPYATQVGQACLCKQNFVKNGTACYCPATFVVDFSAATCTCNGYVEDKLCNACSFLCKTCHGGGINCDSFSPYFYIIVAAIALLVVIAAVLLIRKFITSRASNRASLLETDKADSQHQNIQQS